MQHPERLGRQPQQFVPHPFPVKSQAQGLTGQLVELVSLADRSGIDPARREGLGEGADITWGSGGGWSDGRRQQASRAGHLLDGGLHVRGLDSLSAGAGGLD